MSFSNLLTPRSWSSNTLANTNNSNNYLKAFFSHIPYLAWVWWHFVFFCLSCFLSQWQKLTALKSWTTSPATAFSEKNNDKTKVWAVSLWSSSSAKAAAVSFLSSFFPPSSWQQTHGCVCMWQNMCPWVSMGCYSRNKRQESLVLRFNLTWLTLTPSLVSWAKSGRRSQYHVPLRTTRSVLWSLLT